VNHSAAFLAEMLATMVLFIGILALIDEKNRSTTVASFPSCVGVLVIGIGMAFSLISSAALNPARDLGPRIMLSMVGYDGVFSADGYYFWVPLVAPVVGAVVGVYVYLLFVMGHHPAKVERHGFF
jgi:glycerol uptake facilitator-like aquaporin